LIRSGKNSKAARSKLSNQVKRIFYLREHVRTQEEPWWLLWSYLAILSTFEKSFSIARDNQKAENDSTRAFTAKQLKDFETFDSFILDNRHCVFRFVFALIFFRIFLFRSNRIITIVNTASAILAERSFLLWLRKDQDMFTHDLLARTHFKHFKRDEKSSMAIQKWSEREQRSQAISISIS